jgi:hypothetical protein
VPRVELNIIPEKKETPIQHFLLPIPATAIYGGYTFEISQQPVSPVCIRISRRKTVEHQRIVTERPDQISLAQIQINFISTSSGRATFQLID